MPSRCEKDAASLPRARTIRPARVCRVVERAVVVEFGEQRIDKVAEYDRAGEAVSKRGWIALGDNGFGDRDGCVPRIRGRRDRGGGCARSVMPTRSAIVRTHAVRSRAMQVRTSAWLVRKVERSRSPAPGARLRATIR